MKLKFLITVILLGSFFVFNKVNAANTDIVINEIGSSPTSTHEWVEIWNKGNESIDIKDWKFWENNTNHALKAVTTSDSIISPKEFAVICQDSDVFLLDYPNFIGSVFDSSWSSLSENGEQIGLKDETGNFVEDFTYVSTTKYSLERKDPYLNDYTSANWQENLFGNSVGAQNSNFNIGIISTSTNNNNSSENTTTTPTSTEQLADSQTNSSSTSTVLDWTIIKLNEILSDPTDGNEMVEFYNNSSSTFDITGALICDSTGSSCKSLSGTIFGHDWLVADLLTDRYLNNAGDRVVLKDDKNNIIDEVVYGNSDIIAPENSQSLIRKVDGMDSNNDSDWAVTTKITLGASNVLEAPIVKVYNSGSNGNASTNNGSVVLATTTKVTKVSTKTVSTTPNDPVKISFKLDYPYGLDVDEVGQFSAQGTVDPRGGDVGVSWNWGDNATSTGFVVSHSYATSGIYLVSVSASSTANTLGRKEFKVFVGPDFSISKSQIKINNYLVNATSSEDEFVELKNFSTSSQNISNWKIKNMSGKEYEIPENTIIRASSTLKFFRGVTHLSFDKDGDTILLSSSNDKELDKKLLRSKKIIKAETNMPKVSVAKSISNWRSAKGVVTVLPGVFGSQYFYIFDGEQGYQVYQYKKDFPSLEIGDEISVSGVESVVSGMKRIKISNKYSVDILATDRDVEAIVLSTEELVSDHLGALVKISGDVTSIKSSYLYIDDGSGETVIYFRPAAKIDNQNFKLGDKLEVVGILEQTKNGFRVSPRSNEDIKVIGYSDEVLSQQNQADQASQNEVRDKYLTATAGGVTTLLLGFLARARGAILVGGAKRVASVIGNVIKRG